MEIGWRKLFWALVRIIIGFAILQWLVPEVVIFMTALAFWKCVVSFAIFYFMYTD